MSKPLDRLTLLETFARIAARGSISAAARDLGLSQASASRQLKALETRLGAELIRRTTHALTLTPAGQALLGDARLLLADWGRLEECHGPGDGAVRGPLKVVAPLALGQGHLLEIALAFQADYPEVSLTWELEDAAIRFAEVGCDCWLRVGAVPDETLIRRPLGSVERLLVASPALVGGEGPADPEAAAALPLVALSPFEGGRIALHDARGGETTLRPPLRMITNNVLAVRRAVLQGLGMAILPKWFVAEDLQAGRLVDLLPDWRAARLEISAAFLPARRQPRRLALFLEAMTAGVRAIPGVAAP
ncbi:MAG: LysR family transcriptional regulator [Rhodospirillales bacterium]